MNDEGILDEYDYAAWGCPRHVWPSVDAFLSAPNIADGIHSIDCAGLPIDLLFHGSPLDSPGFPVVPVFFSGVTSTARHEKRSPRFSDLCIARAGSTPSICVADPTLVLDSTLRLAWYAGSALQPTQVALTVVLEGLAVRSERELLLIGGSGGGFAALYCGYILGFRASVLVWNPQTDWIEYEETAVRHYLAAAYPELPLPSKSGCAFRQAASSLMQSFGVVHSLVPIAKQAGATVPRRLVYLQNGPDCHVARHAAPFLDAVDYRDIGDGFHLSPSGEGIIWFANWGKEHATAPGELIELVLQRMLDVDMRPAALIAEIRGSEMACYIDSENAPRDLRQAIFSVTVSVASTGDTLHAQVHLDPPPKRQGRLSYAFYLFSGEERIATRWYENKSSYVHAEIRGKPVTKVTAFVRDGFDRQLSIQETREIVRTAVPPALPQHHRVHIYGSCVSRDAFELADHDFVIVGYIARSSLASAFDARMPPREMTALLPNIESAFQRRMVDWDLSRSAGALLRDSQSDVILLDLIDERFSLLNAGDALVTMSVEFSRTGYSANTEQVVPSGSEGHLAAWRNGLDAFLVAMGSKRLIVNRVYWATRDTHGDLLAKQAWIARNNLTLSVMYEHLAIVPGIRFIDYPDELLVADTDHKWGVSPFHYPEAMYVYMMHELGKLLEAPESTGNVVYNQEISARLESQ